MIYNVQYDRTVYGTFDLCGDDRSWHYMEQFIGNNYCKLDHDQDEIIGRLNKNAANQKQKYCLRKIVSICQAYMAFSP